MGMSPKLLRPRLTGFSPKNISGLATWLDADDSTTVTLNGTTVSEWRDKSGNGRHASQATAANQPTYTANALNGKRALTTTGTAGQGMTLSAWTYSTNNTAIFVFKTAGLNQAVFQRGSVNAEGSALVQNPGSGLVLRARRGGASADSEISYTANEWVIGAAVITSSSVRVYKNGVYGTTQGGTLAYSGSVALRLFALSSTLYTMNGSIAEFLYYDSALSESQVTSVAKYLSKKWNITLS